MDPEELAVDAIETEKRVLEAAEKTVRKLNKLIADGHDTTAFIIAIAIAAIKDAADVTTTFTLFGFVPVLGKLPGLFITTVLTLFLWGKGWSFFKKTRLRIIWFLCGFLFDNLPGFDALPVTVILTFIAWRDVRKKAAKAELDLSELPEKTVEEIQKIEEETLVTDSEAAAISQSFQQEMSEAVQEVFGKIKKKFRPRAGTRTGRGGASAGDRLEAGEAQGGGGGAGGGARREEEEGEEGEEPQPEETEQLTAEQQKDQDIMLGHYIERMAREYGAEGLYEQIDPTRIQAAAEAAGRLLPFRRDRPAQSRPARRTRPRQEGDERYNKEVDLRKRKQKREAA